MTVAVPDGVPAAVSVPGNDPEPEPDPGFELSKSAGGLELSASAGGFELSELINHLTTRQIRHPLTQALMILSRPAVAFFVALRVSTTSRACFTTHP